MAPPRPSRTSFHLYDINFTHPDYNHRRPRSLVPVILTFSAAVLFTFLIVLIAWVKSKMAATNQPVAAAAAAAVAEAAPPPQSQMELVPLEPPAASPSSSSHDE